MSLPKILIGGRRWLFGWLVANGVVQAVLGLAIVRVFDNFYHAGFTGLGSVAAIFALGAGLYAGRILQRRHGEMFALDYVNETRCALMEKVLSAPDNARHVRIGLVTARLSGDLLSLKNWLADGLASGIVTGTMLTALLIGAAVLFPAIALILAAVVIPWAVIALILRPSLRDTIGKARRLRGKLANTAGDQVMTRLTLAHFGRTNPALENLVRRGQELSQTLVHRATISEALRATPDWALPIASLAGYLALHGGTAAPRLAPLLLLLHMTGLQMSKLSRALDLYVASAVAKTRLTSVIDRPGLIDTASGKMPEFERGTPLKLDLALTDPDGMIQQIHIVPGSAISLTGGTQAWRSDVLMALARLRDGPSLSGTIGGSPIQEVSLKSWRKLVTLVSPRLPFIRGTIRKNLLIGAPSRTTDDAVLSLARRFGIASALRELEEPLDPYLMTDSQALAARLCRAILRAAPIILLDEVTRPADAAMIEDFLALARQRQAIVIASGCVLDRAGKPIGSEVIGIGSAPRFLPSPVSACGSDGGGSNPFPPCAPPTAPAPLQLLRR
jgi:ABC-type multidrug transport system fused ATPase/permease subunit